MPFWTIWTDLGFLCVCFYFIFFWKDASKWFFFWACKMPSKRLFAFPKAAFNLANYLFSNFSAFWCVTARGQGKVQTPLIKNSNWENKLVPTAGIFWCFFGTRYRHFYQKAVTYQINYVMLREMLIGFDERNSRQVTSQETLCTAGLYTGFEAETRFCDLCSNHTPHASCNFPVLCVCVWVCVCVCACARESHFFWAILEAALSFEPLPFQVAYFAITQWAFEFDTD